MTGYFRDEDIISRFFYALRGLAIISVSYAHSLSLSDITDQRIGAIIGILGVPLFLFCSGFYFKQDSWKNLWRKLSKTIISPWLLWGTFAFTVSVTLKSVNLDLSSFISYILGHGTWLYYVPVYIAVRIMFNIEKLGTNLAFIIGTVFLSIISTIVITPPLNKLAYINGWISPYQNPFNWIGFFSLGIIFNRYNLLTRISELKGYIKLPLICMPIFIFTLLLIGTGKVNYWNPLGMVLEYMTVLSVPFLAFISKSDIIVILGKYSYILYLLHMQLGIALANIIFRSFELPDFVLLIIKPFVVLGITMCIVILIRRLLFALKLCKINQLIGLPLN